MLFAVHAGGGTMAQFSIPELGGSGQWMRGGMTMVGDMFDNALKARVDALCGELAQLLTTTTVFPASATGAAAGSPRPTGGRQSSACRARPAPRTMRATPSSPARGGWPSRSTASQRFSTPGSTASVACSNSRAADTVRWVSPASSAPSRCPRCPSSASSRWPRLRSPRPPRSTRVSTSPRRRRNRHQRHQHRHPSGPHGGSGDPATIVAAIESLAGLHQRGILSDDEFAAKKAELLARL